MGQGKWLWLWMSGGSGDPGAGLCRVDTIRRRIGKYPVEVATLTGPQWKW